MDADRGLMRIQFYGTRMNTDLRGFSFMGRGWTRIRADFFLF
jgi:hypothetical protein